MTIEAIVIMKRGMGGGGKHISAFKRIKFNELNSKRKFVGLLISIRYKMMLLSQGTEINQKYRMALRKRLKSVKINLVYNQFISTCCSIITKITNSHS